MAGVVRQGDNCSGHATFAPRPPTSWSPDVFANGKNVVRFGDSWSIHCCPPPICHGGSTVGGGSVYVNGKVLQISGDPIDCGSTCAASSSDVFAKGKD